MQFWGFFDSTTWLVGSSFRRYLLPPKTKPEPLAVKAQHPNHWASRKVPRVCTFKPSSQRWWWWCSVPKSCLTFATPWTVACQASLSMGFPWQEYWSAQPFPSPGDLPDSGIKPRSPGLQMDLLLSEPSYPSLKEIKCHVGKMKTFGA